MIYMDIAWLLQNLGSSRIITPQTENPNEDKGYSLDLNSKIITIEEYCINYALPHFTNSSKLITKM